jgi:anti-sigma factor ChrR (cupin superfamily)
VKKNASHPKDLAPLHALGALDGDDLRDFARLLELDPDARGELSGFTGVLEALARSVPAAATPSPDLKARILREAERRKARAAAEIELRKLVPASHNGLAFLKNADSPGWLPLPVAGAFVKLLSFDQASGYAVVLGKLDAGSRYPSHTHVHPEDIFMLSGDLHVGDEVLRAGDFHHAEAGSRHGVNWSEQGCTLLAVLSRDDLLAQLVPR